MDLIDYFIYSSIFIFGFFSTMWVGNKLPLVLSIILLITYFLVTELDNLINTLIELEINDISPNFWGILMLGISFFVFNTWLRNSNSSDHGLEVIDNFKDSFKIAGPHSSEYQAAFRDLEELCIKNNISDLSQKIHQSVLSHGIYSKQVSEALDELEYRCKWK